jgi:signal transduction histidine kinase/ligand-binding sensor domain-containing protein/DNA-binding response OmpR family regulator
MFSHRFIRMLLLLLPCCMLQSGADAQSYYFRNYQAGNGISSNTITSILQDRKGFMWFGTRNGLNRFDGNSFRIFKQDPNDSTSIGSNSVLSLYEDNDEQLWIGTYKGIYRYDPKEDRFYFFDLLPAGEVRYIKADKQQQVWIICDFHLYKYDPADRSLQKFDSSDAQELVLTISGQGDCYTANSWGQIKKYDARRKQFTSYELPSAQSYTAIQDIYPFNDSLVLFGTMDKVYLFNTHTRSLHDVFAASGIRSVIQLHKIIRQSATTWWLGTETGIYIFDLHKGITNLVEKEYGNPYSITDNVIYSFCQDKEGGTWVGTFFGGINYYSQQTNRFQKFFPHNGPDRLGGNLVHEICRDEKQNIWIGTEDAGLHKLDPKTGRIKQFLPGAGNGSISYQNIHGLVACGNELWIGTYEHGLDVMDLRTEKVIRHYKAGNKENDLHSNFIVTLYKTRNNEVLVGTWTGLLRYNRATDDFTTIPGFNTQVQGITEDDQGTIWFCSYGNGVYYYNAANNSSGNLRFDPNNSNSLCNNYVNSLYRDSRGNFWFCTENGLCSYDPHTKQFRRYNNLPDQVFRVLEDDKGMLWISTSRGLFNMNRAGTNGKLYTTAQGLLSDQFNYNSGYKAPDGTMYFGSVKGMISFNPAHFKTSGFVPPVYITHLQVNNKDQLVNRDGSSLQRSILYTNDITLPHDRSTLSLDVAALSYSMPGTNEYVYKMEGLDKDWITMQSNRRIYYTKLPPGNYVFKVKGAAGGDVWNPLETILRIHILPPWWASWWAYTLYVLTGAGILFIILRYYLIAVKEKNKRMIDTLEMEKEREIYNAKIEFFTNIAHEIRTPLTLIKLPLDKLMRTNTDNSSLTESLEMMKKNTNRLIDLTDQLLDFRKAEANKFSLNFIRTDISDVLKELFHAFKPIAEEKKLLLKLEMPRMPLQAYVDAEAFRKIMSNLLNNAIKYAASSVTVRLKPFNSNDQVFNIEIRNDGHLIPYELKEKIFEPFYRLKVNEKQPGTGIGLPLSRSLAELHKGVLDLQQPENGFNIFLLSIPIHQEHEIDLQDYETIETEQTMMAEEEPVKETDPGKLHLLLVEDNKEILSFLQRELQAAYTISRAGNGEEALEILNKENIHLVISDIMMPVMDGIELCKRIKTDLQFSHIPIILLTARNTMHSRIEGLEVGADAYIEKPFAFEHLQAQITNLLSNRNTLKEYFARTPLTHIKGIASSKADKDFLEQLHTVINAHITDTELDVDKLSRLMNMSRTSFYRKIKALSDLTPNELINLSRLKLAAELLAEGSYKINEVAGMVGYSINSNFSRDFSKQFGKTPSQYLSELGKKV